MSKSPRLLGRTKRLLNSTLVRYCGTALVGIAISSCGAGSSDQQATADPAKAATSLSLQEPHTDISTVTVEAVSLVAERRVGRTLFEYDYQITVLNPGDPFADVAVTLLAVGPGTEIVNGVLPVGFMGSRSFFTPTGVVTIRQDRSLPFQPDLLRWKVTGTAVPNGTNLLAGSPDSNAVDAIQNFESGSMFPDQEFEVIPGSEVRILRSRVILGFVPSATVSQINALLQSIQGSIDNSYVSVPMIAVRISDPGSATLGDALVGSLRSSPLVRYVALTHIEQPFALPTSMQTVGSIEHIANLLSVRAAPAWNARRAYGFSTYAGQPPFLAVADYFGQGPFKQNDLLNTILAGNYGSGFSFAPPHKSDGHGYTILGLMAATFNGPIETADSSSVTGGYPSISPLFLGIQDALKDGNKKRTLTELAAELIKPMIGSGNNVVLNTSWGCIQCGEAYNIVMSKLWQDLTGYLSQDMLFHAAAAGNSGLRTEQESTIALARRDYNLRNTLIVESRSRSSLLPFNAGCLSDFVSTGGLFVSDFGGDISAIGENLRSYGDAKGTEFDGFGGTSFAAPQVAGLAAYFWSIRPDLTSLDVASAIRNNATPAIQVCPNTFPLGAPAGAPLIDAYATILGADEQDGLLSGNRGRVPVRMAILDVDEDGQFTAADAMAFADAFVIGNGSSSLSAPIRTLPVGSRSLDLSRFDLNGDGKVGGTFSGRFNLDISYAAPKGREATYTVVEYPLFNSDGTVARQEKIDEHEVTDWQVLCYYVNSPLWSDSKGTRSKLDTALNIKGILACNADSEYSGEAIYPPSFVTGQCHELWRIFLTVPAGGTRASIAVYLYCLDGSGLFPSRIFSQSFTFVIPGSTTVGFSTIGVEFLSMTDQEVIVNFLLRDIQIVLQRR
jgi:Subtilase family